MTLFVKYPKSGVYYMDFVCDGKRIQKSCQTTDYDKALKAQELEKRKIKEGVTSPSPLMTLKDAAEIGFKERWIETVTGEQTRMRLLEVAKILKNPSITEIDSTSIHKVCLALKKRGLSPATINRYLAHIKTMLTMAELDWGLPIKKFRIKKFIEPEGRQRVISYDEENLILELLRSDKGRGKRFSFHMADLVEVLIGTGMRLGEALTITYQDNIFLDEKLIKLTASMTKTKHSRRIPFKGRVYDILNERKREFPKQPFPYLKTTVVNKWAKLRKALGLAHDDEFVLHALRHTYASRLVDEGVSIYDVKKLLGHTQITTTERYAKLDLSALRRAVDHLPSTGGKGGV